MTTDTALPPGLLLAWLGDDFTGSTDTMEALGFARGQYVIKVNNRKLLDGLREVVGLSGAADDARWLTVMRALDKYDRLGLDDHALLFADAFRGLRDGPVMRQGKRAGRGEVQLFG